ncbi:MAG: hypothetical protein ACLSBH_00740 [Coprobacillus cateniformis]
MVGIFRIVDDQVSVAVIIGIAKTQDKWEVFLYIMSINGKSQL